jgi:putative FmdB family regulatory protein
MPIYEYQCESCQHRLEAIQKFSDPPLSACPKCGASVRKLQSAPAFQFKGDGWYITDYAKKDGDKKKEGEKTDAGAAKTDATGGASSDAKSSESKASGDTSTSSAASSPAAPAASPAAGGTKALS